MSHTATSGRPEPVLDEAKVAGKISGVATGLLTVAAVAGLVGSDDVPGLVAACVAIGGGLVTVVNYVVPRVRAMRARAKVTPLADPRDEDGLPLRRTYITGG